MRPSLRIDDVFVVMSPLAVQVHTVSIHDRTVLTGVEIRATFAPVGGSVDPDVFEVSTYDLSAGGLDVAVHSAIAGLRGVKTARLKTEFAIIEYVAKKRAELAETL